MTTALHTTALLTHGTDRLAVERDVLLFANDFLVAAWVPERIPIPAKGAIWVEPDIAVAAVRTIVRSLVKARDACELLSVELPAPLLAKIERLVALVNFMFRSRHGGFRLELVESRL